MTTRTNLALAFVALALPLAAICTPAAPHGALAVGSTGNVSKDGIAVGRAINHKTLDAAKEAAIRDCTAYQPAPKSAKFCRLVGSFTKECYAVAVDPQVGTPGAGWAIAADIEVAEQRAIDACGATAGKGRAQFCWVEESECDTVE